MSTTPVPVPVAGEGGEHRRTGSSGGSSDATPPASGSANGDGARTGGTRRPSSNKPTTTSTGSSAAAAAAPGPGPGPGPHHGHGPARRRSTVSNPYDPFFQADAKFVGSSSLISSPNTIEPTDKIFVRPPPMPSVHTDGRGEVWNLRVGSHHPDAETVSRRINLSHTKKDVMRHGDFHPNRQCGFLFAGKLEVWTPGPDGRTQKKLYGPKDYVEVAPYVPHVYNYVEDTIMAEWWESAGSGEGSHFKHWFYAPYRRIVDVSFVKTTAGEKGKLRVFREQVGAYFGVSAEGEEDDMMAGIPSKTNWAGLFGAAAVVGAVGFALGVSMSAGSPRK
eukprot:CAMPEP_0181052052 /NCGR_PEP_ID=MMETSP1070-20121207/17386_1 /TAXON_ID=265543 /ORGANISM="Minutocellus polymorphus, Strain NH13" /LENGTH=332 /DNA_ID=CAMNT_0023131123 /DNA_START=82 /DNA_END=1080 /DNA_ORIENTATION=+